MTKNTPTIRFAGYTDAWEQRKVSDLLEERNEQAPESEDYPLMAFIANEGVAPKGERYDRGALVKDAENKNYKKTELGDFIYSSNNLETGSIGLNNYGNASISPVYSIFKPTGIADSDFIGRRFVRKDFINSMVKWRQGVVYGQWKIHESDFLKIEVAVPSLEEQRKIGSYLSELDNLITLHQRKYDGLQLFNKSMLQKMFPKDGETKPEIRFAGFTDVWEQRKLGEVCERVTRKNKSGESDLPLTIASQYGLIDQRDFFNKVVAAKDMSNYYLLKKGEFAYNKSYSNGFDYGSIKRLNAYEQGCLSTLYICFGITSDDIESDYLECYFDTLKWYGDVSQICAEGARNHGLLNVDTNAFFDEVTIEMPSSKEEQKKISAYLNNLDKLITLHQRKLEQLKNTKKALLQNMLI